MQANKLVQAGDPSHAAAWVEHFGFAQATHACRSGDTTEAPEVLLLAEPPKASGGAVVVLVASQATSDSFQHAHKTTKPNLCCILFCIVDLADG
jgi:hypothetical protein